MYLGEVAVTHVYYNFTKFHQNRMKNKKVLFIAHLTDMSSINKALLRSCFKGQVNSVLGIFSTYLTYSETEILIEMFTCIILHVKILLTRFWKTVIIIDKRSSAFLHVYCDVGRYVATFIYLASIFCIRYIFCQITTFIKAHATFVFGLQTLW